MDDNTQSIYDVEERLDEIVRYFEEIEAKLTEQSGFPVKLPTFGIGDTVREAYHDALDEIGDALEALWEAR